MAKKLLNTLFITGILLVLLAGLVRTVCFPKQINTYENRYANQVESFSPGAYLDGSFQDSVDKALSDQVLFSSYCKKLYRLGMSGLQKALVLPIAAAHPNRYINLPSSQLFNGTHLTFYTRTLSAMTENLSTTADNYNHLFAALPDVDFYLYFIEKDTDINLATGEKVMAYEYFRDQLDLPDDRIARLKVDSFEDFSRWFYRTDHHWNYVGSYEGYQQVLALLGVEEEPLVPVETVTLSQSFSGSKATSDGSAAFSEPFTAYRFDYPPMSVTVNGYPGDYGNQDAFFRGEMSRPTYGSFYGGDMGEVIFDTGSEGRGNLLVIGESYDNAILKLLASHFDRTCSVDLRYYKNYMGKDFSLSDYVAKHGIDKVLIIGNIDCFLIPEFRMEG